MKKILIYMDINENEYAIYEKTKYRQLNDVIQTERKGNCPNYGNKVWLQALVSELTTSEVQYKFWNTEMSYEYINSEFDCIIKPSANIFSTLFVERLYELIKVEQKNSEGRVAMERGNVDRVKKAVDGSGKDVSIKSILEKLGKGILKLVKN